ncbi:hypothetical protein BH11PLA1_BH11PLA1_20990 [soil metagenome]
MVSRYAALALTAMVFISVLGCSRDTPALSSSRVRNGLLLPWRGEETWNLVDVARFASDGSIGCVPQRSQGHFKLLSLLGSAPIGGESHAPLLSPEAIIIASDGRTFLPATADELAKIPGRSYSIGFPTSYDSFEPIIPSGVTVEISQDYRTVIVAGRTIRQPFRSIKNVGKDPDGRYIVIVGCDEAPEIRDRVSFGYRKFPGEEYVTLYDLTANRCAKPIRLAGRRDSAQPSLCCSPLSDRFLLISHDGQTAFVVPYTEFDFRPSN